MGVRSDRQHGKGERGALSLEIVLVVSLLMLMSASVIEIGRYMAVWHGVNSAAREGADFAASHGEGSSPETNCSEIKWEAVTSSGLADLDPTDVSVTFEDATGHQIHACTVTNEDPDAGALPDGARVIVGVVREVDPLTPPVTRLVGQLTITARESVAVSSR